MLKDPMPKMDEALAAIIYVHVQHKISYHLSFVLLRSYG